MKTAESKTTATQARHSQKESGQPFFNKDGEGGFFSEPKSRVQPFFQPSPSPFIQTKLTIGQPGDKYEREADAKADEVVRQLSNGGSQEKINGQHSPVTGAAVQAKCAECEQEEKEQVSLKEVSIQRKPIFESAGEPDVQAKFSPISPPLQKQEEAPKEEGRISQKEESLQRKSIFESEAMPTVQAKLAPIRPPLIQREEVAPEAEEEMAVQEESLQMKPIFDGGGDPSDDDAIQQKCDSCADEDGPIQKMGVPAEAELVQTEPNGAAPTSPPPDLESRLNGTKGGGFPLPVESRSQMEGAFGVDFSSVRVHTNGTAVQMNKELGAQAFTHGSDIYFGSGKYDPWSPDGQQLLAHELTHVVQQGAAVKRSLPVQKMKEKAWGDESEELEIGQAETSDNTDIQAKCVECEQEDQEQKGQISPKEENIQRKPIFESEANPAVQTKASPIVLPVQKQEEVLQEQEEEQLVQKDQLQMKAIFDGGAEPPDDDARQQNFNFSAAVEGPVQKMEAPAEEELVQTKPAIQRNEEEDLAKELEEADREQVEAVDPEPAEESRQEAEAENVKAQEETAQQAEEAKEGETNEEPEKKIEKEERKVKAKKRTPDKVEPAILEEETTKGPAAEFLDQESENVCDDGAAKTQELADNEQAHDDAGEKLQQTEVAVEPPAEEGQSRSNAGQVETVEGMEEPTPNETEVEAEFDRAIEESVPSDIDEMNEFESEGRAKVVGNKVLAKTSEEVGAVQGTYNEIENAPPAPAPEKPEALPEIETAPETPELNLGKDAVPELAEEHTDFSEYESQSDELLEKEGVSQEQLDMVDSGDLAEANKEKKGLKKKVEEEPGKIKTFAKEKQKKVETDLKKEEQEGKAAMKAKREKELEGSKQKQEKAKSEMELKREKVTEHINKIYETAKANVTLKLENLEQQSLKAFDVGQAQYSKTFEIEVKRDINAWKRDRYSGFWAGVKWLRDKILGIADFPEVQSAFDRARERYVQRIDQLILQINQDNNKVIQECKDELAKAKLEIKEYVDGLGPDLRKTGQAAMNEMKDKLAEMDAFIDKKKEELQQKLCDKKEAAIKAIDEKIEAMKSEMGGLLSLLGNLLLEAAKKFFKWAIESFGGDPQPVLNIIDKGAAVVKAIFTDPIGFFVNLGKAVGGGINRFVSNITTHLKKGLIGWLTGAMGDSGLQIPEKFDIKGILSLGLQVAGLTWNMIRTKLVKALGPAGEKMMGMAESGMSVIQRVREEGPIALWHIIQEKAAEFKEKAMEGIKNWVVTTVIKKATTKLLTMLNPAGAIVQAIIMLYDTVMFFVENWQRILDFVNSIFDSIGEIAKGAIGKASAFIERTLAMTIPMIISFLARFIGLSGIGKAIKKIIDTIRKPIQKILDKIVKFLAKQVRKLFGKGGKKASKDKDSDPKKAAKIQAGLNDIDKEEKKYLTGGKISEEEAKKVADTVKKRHKVFKSLKIVDGGKKWDYMYEASPKKKHTTKPEKEEVEDTSMKIKKYAIKPPFTVYANNPVEFKSQIKNQEDGINKMKVSKWKENRNNFKKDGRGKDDLKDLRDRIRRDIADAYKRKNTHEFIKQGLSPNEINDQSEAYAKSILTRHHAILHNPDQVAGGEAMIGSLYQKGEITDAVSLKASKLVGHGGTNSSIGSQWAKQGRIQGLDKHVEIEMKKLTPEEKTNKEMHVVLTNYIE